MRELWKACGMDVAPAQPAQLSDEEGIEIEEVTAFKYLGRITNNDKAINARIKIVNEERLAKIKEISDEDDPVLCAPYYPFLDTARSDLHFSRSFDFRLSEAAFNV